MNGFFPSDYQPQLKIEDLIVPAQEKDENSIELDVLFIGAGPASLTSAIKLSDLLNKKNQTLQIGILEKADTLGGHSLSGAIINPLIFKSLFKETTPFPFRKKVEKEGFYFLTEKQAFPLPVPPQMKNKDCWTASLCEVVKWLGKEAENRGVHIFTSCPASQLMVKDNQIVGALSQPTGINKDGSQEASYTPSMKIFSKVTLLGEGSRGHLTQAYIEKMQLQGHYPQTYALGVKEIWEVKKEPKKIIHTIAWPLESQTFGGSWLYPLGDNKISLGLVAGLDSPSANLSVHHKLQELKEHPLFATILKEGKCLEWGAKTIPEGGYKALPKTQHGHGLLILGDSAGFVNMASLKGIHYAMASGVLAAETLITAFEKNDFSKETLKVYDKKIQNSFIQKELYTYRNLRQSFHKGLWKGLLQAGLITLTQGRWPSDFKKEDLSSDVQVQRFLKEKKEKKKGLSKTDAVFLSGNQTRDKIPSHLKTKNHLPKELIQFYENMCPAAVYEEKENQLVVNAPNCIDCKATDILGPRWTPRERGSGPNYKLM